MVNPYRTPPLSERARDVRDNLSDDHILGIVLMLIGGLRVAIALVEHEVFEAEATFALMMMSAGGVLLLRRR